jgi:hypothetical protein
MCRFVINSLQKFEPAQGGRWGVLSMSDFLLRARRGNQLPVRGETAFLAHPNNHDRGLSAPLTTLGGCTVSKEIMVRWGALRGVKGPLNVHAVYFPIECAASLPLCGACLHYVPHAEHQKMTVMLLPDRDLTASIPRSR